MEEIRNKKLGQEPAFAQNYEYYKDGIHNVQVYNGMSKRFYAACAAMQGMLANSKYSDTELNNSTTEVIEICYKIADELLKQENL